MSGVGDRDPKKGQPKDDEAARAVPPALGEHVLQVRVGHGANCSSIGSVVDTLFATATVGAAVFAAVVAALAREPTKVTPWRGKHPEKPRGGEGPP